MPVVMAGIGESDIVAVGFEVVDTAVVVATGTVAVDIGEFGIAALAVADTAEPDTAALAVPIVYPSCSLFPQPLDRLSTHPHPYPFHNLPLGIMGNHAFACIVLPKMALFRTL